MDESVVCDDDITGTHVNQRLVGMWDTALRVFHRNRLPMRTNNDAKGSEFIRQVLQIGDSVDGVRTVIRVGEGNVCPPVAMPARDPTFRFLFFHRWKRCERKIV